MKSSLLFLNSVLLFQHFLMKSQGSVGLLLGLLEPEGGERYQEGKT